MCHYFVWRMYAHAYAWMKAPWFHACINVRMHRHVCLRWCLCVYAPGWLARVCASMLKCVTTTTHRGRRRRHWSSATMCSLMCACVFECSRIRAYSTHIRRRVRKCTRLRVRVHIRRHTHYHVHIHIHRHSQNYSKLRIEIFICMFI